MTSGLSKVCVVFIPWIGCPVLNSALPFGSAWMLCSVRIAVEDVERLSDAHAEDVRMVAAFLLIDFDRLGRRVVHVIAEAVLHVHEHVGERLAVAADFERLLELRASCFRAGRSGRRSS